MAIDKEMVRLKKRALTEYDPDMIVCTLKIKNPFMTLKRWVKEYDIEYEQEYAERMCEKKSPDEYLFETHLDKIIDLAYWKSQIADSKTFSKEIRIMKRVSGQPCYSFYTWSDLTAEIFKIWDSPVTEYNTVKIKLQMMNHLINQVEFSYY